ncbi:MAG: hypothetical protein ACLGXA_09585 [Acidobacteriota bacterium]
MAVSLRGKKVATSRYRDHHHILPHRKSLFSWTYHPFARKRTTTFFRGRRAPAPGVLPGGLFFSVLSDSESSFVSWAEPSDFLLQLVRHTIVVERKFCDPDVSAGTVQLAFAATRNRELFAKRLNPLL